MRLTKLTTDDLTENQKQVYLAAQPRRGNSIQGPSLAWLRSPVLYEHVNAMVAYLRHRSVLAPRIREFAILIVIAEWDAPYPWKAHAGMAGEAGVSADVIEALRVHRQPEFSNADEQAVYTFSAELRKKRVVSDATYQAVLGHLGEQGLVELTTLLGLYDIVCMTTNVFEIPAQQ